MQGRWGNILDEMRRAMMRNHPEIAAIEYALHALERLDKKLNDVDIRIAINEIKRILEGKKK